MEVVSPSARSGSGSSAFPTVAALKKSLLFRPEICRNSDVCFTTFRHQDSVTVAEIVHFLCCVFTGNLCRRIWQVLQLHGAAEVGTGVSVWSLHVLPVPAWAFFRLPSSFPQFRNMRISLFGGSNFVPGCEWMFVSCAGDRPRVNPHLSPSDCMERLQHLPWPWLGIPQYTRSPWGRGDFRCSRYLVWFGLVQHLNLFLGIVSLPLPTLGWTEAAWGQEVNPEPHLVQHILPNFQFTFNCDGELSVDQIDLIQPVWKEKPQIQYSRILLLDVCSPL